jgi:hypothetical protein
MRGGSSVLGIRTVGDEPIRFKSDVRPDLFSKVLVGTPMPFPHVRLRCLGSEDPSHRR